MTPWSHRAPSSDHFHQDHYSFHPTWCRIYAHGDIKWRCDFVINLVMACEWWSETILHHQDCVGVILWAMMSVDGNMCGCQTSYYQALTRGGINDARWVQGAIMTGNTRTFLQTQCALLMFCQFVSWISKKNTSTPTL